MAVENKNMAVEKKRNILQKVGILFEALFFSKKSKKKGKERKLDEEKERKLDEEKDIKLKGKEHQNDNRNEEANVKENTSNVDFELESPAYFVDDSEDVMGVFERKVVCTRESLNSEDSGYNDNREEIEDSKEEECLEGMFERKIVPKIKEECIEGMFEQKLVPNIKEECIEDILERKMVPKETNAYTNTKEIEPKNTVNVQDEKDKFERIKIENKTTETNTDEVIKQLKGLKIEELCKMTRQTMPKKDKASKIEDNKRQDFIVVTRKTKKDEEIKTGDKNKRPVPVARQPVPKNRSVDRPHPYPERIGTERNGAERIGTEWIGAQRIGTETITTKVLSNLHCGGQTIVNYTHDFTQSSYENQTASQGLSILCDSNLGLSSDIPTISCEHQNCNDQPSLSFPNGDLPFDFMPMQKEIGHCLQNHYNHYEPGTSYQTCPEDEEPLHYPNTTQINKVEYNGIHDEYVLNCIKSWLEDKSENRMKDLESMATSVLMEALQNTEGPGQIVNLENVTLTEPNVTESGEIESRSDIFPTPPRTSPLTIENNSGIYTHFSNVPNASILTPCADDIDTRLENDSFYFIGSTMAEGYLQNPDINFSSPESMPMSNQSAMNQSNDESTSVSSPDVPSPNEIFQDVIRQTPIRQTVPYLKEYKRMMENITNFNDKECCKNRRPCQEIMQEKFEKLSYEQRKGFLVKVAELNRRKESQSEAEERVQVAKNMVLVKNVLVEVLNALSPKVLSFEDKYYSLFSLLCGFILNKFPQLYWQYHGVELLKEAVMKCPHRPILTRYLVHCVRTAFGKCPPAELTTDWESVYNETTCRQPMDRLSLISDCVRGGDQYADCLAELLMKQHGELPLFNINRLDEDCTPLHVACFEHSPEKPRLHTVHVLHKHGNMDLNKGEGKGGDTPLHLACRSPHCDINLVLLLLHCHHPTDQFHWRTLVNTMNRSNKTPRDYAQASANDAARNGRQNDAQKVLQFIKKRINRNK